MQAAAELERAFPPSSCARPGSNLNTEDAFLLNALYNTKPRMPSSCHAASSCAAYLTVGVALLPFSILDCPEARLGGIPEDLIVVVDYDESQLRAVRAVVEVVRSIEVSVAEVRDAEHGSIVDWWLPTVALAQLDAHVHFAQLRSGSQRFCDRVGLRLHRGRLFAVLFDGPASQLEALLDALSDAPAAAAPPQHARRGTWENELYDALETAGAVRIDRLTQFLDYFHFALGRSVATMFDSAHSFLEGVIGRLPELQEALAGKAMAYLHANLIEQAAELGEVLLKCQVRVSRMNLSNLMDYVQGAEYKQVAQLQLLQHVCPHPCGADTVFLEAYLGGGIRSSLAFRATDWPLYVEAVQIYDQLCEQRALKEASELEGPYQLCLDELRVRCRAAFSSEFVFG